MKLNVLAAKDHSTLDVLNIAKGSAIVAIPTDDPTIMRLYYEGNLYGATNLHNLAERVIVAAGRAAQRAPTVAFLMLPTDDVLNRFVVAAEVDTQSYGVHVNDVDAYMNIQADYDRRIKASPDA